ncbi:hypothetical protein F5Y16DRAFT_402251 [Xylariaceae sp. FL0255]|nr:hypothetical protein F5Y16DRAFT_402251 [Xylariaceae sp. FL0255]
MSDRLSALTPELLLEILCNLPDMYSNSLVRRVLINDMGNELLREALFLDYQEEQLGRPDFDQYHPYQSFPYPAERLPIPATILFAKAARITVNLSRIRFLAEEVLNGCITFDNCLGLASSFARTPITSTERLRIQRAIYLLLIFRNFIGDSADIDENALKNFAAWEILEIGCVSQFSRHDVASARYEMLVNACADTEEVLAILHWGGLKAVYELLKADTYDKRIREIQYDGPIDENTPEFALHDNTSHRPIPSCLCPIPSFWYMLWDTARLKDIGILDNFSPSYKPYDVPLLDIWSDEKVVRYFTTGKKLFADRYRGEWSGDEEPDDEDSNDGFIEQDSSEDDLAEECPV